VLVAAKCSDSVWLSGGYHARLLFTQRASLCVYGSVEPDLIMRTSGCTAVRCSIQAIKPLRRSLSMSFISVLVGATVFTVLLAVGALASAIRLPSASMMPSSISFQHSIPLGTEPPLRIRCALTLVITAWLMRRLPVTALFATLTTACVTVSAGCASICNVIANAFVMACAISGVMFIVLTLVAPPCTEDTQACVRVYHTVHTVHTYLCAPPRRGHLIHLISRAPIKEQTYHRRNGTYPPTYPILTPYGA